MKTNQAKKNNRILTTKHALYQFGASVGLFTSTLELFFPGWGIICAVLGSIFIFFKKGDWS